MGEEDGQSLQSLQLEPLECANSIDLLYIRHKKFGKNLIDTNFYALVLTFER